MTDSGLSAVLEQTYASNSVKHMLSGKAVSRAIRGTLIIDAALHVLLLAQAYNVSCDHLVNSPTALPDDIMQVSKVYDNVLLSEMSIEEACSLPVLSNIFHKITEARKQFQHYRTANLWLQYMDLIQILRNHIRAERTGNWKLYLESLVDMQISIAT